MSLSDDSTARSNVTMRRCTPKSHNSTDRDKKENMPWTSLKVPPFSPDDPEIWFALLEGQFENYGITDDNAQYTQVITNLDMVHAKAIKDIIVNPPTRNRYDKIKTELIRRLSASHEKKVKQLLTHEELGDRKPSQFLRHLLDLAGPSVPEEFIRSIWSGRLPQYLQTVLASQPSHSLEQLADLADRIQEVTSPTPLHVAAAASACACSSAAHGDSARHEIAELRKMVERLELKLDRQTRRPRPGNDRSRPRSRPSSQQRTRSNSSYRNYPICWYHSKSGAQAKRCVKPCDYKAENFPGSR